MRAPVAVNALINGFTSVLKGAAGRAVELRLGLADSVDRIDIDNHVTRPLICNGVLALFTTEAAASAPDV